MNRIFKCLFASLVIGILLSPSYLYAQIQEGQSDQYIRVAEIGELVDSLHVWGDITNPGRYLVPVGTKLPDLISFGSGYAQMRGMSNSGGDFSKRMVEVKVSRYNERQRLVDVAFFRYLYHDPEPIEMFEFDLQNNDVITLQVRQRPSFVDYVNTVAPVVSIIATSILLIENLRGN